MTESESVFDVKKGESSFLYVFRLAMELSTLLADVKMADHLHRYHNGPKPVDLYSKIEKFRSQVTKIAES